MVSVLASPISLHTLAISFFVANVLMVASTDITIYTAWLFLWLLTTYKHKILKNAGQNLKPLRVKGSAPAPDLGG